MKFAIHSGGVKKEQYAYIQVFIDYLREIIEIIKDLLGFVSNLNKTEDESTTA